MVCDLLQRCSAELKTLGWGSMSMEDEQNNTWHTAAEKSNAPWHDGQNFSTIYIYNDFAPPQYGAVITQSALATLSTWSFLPPSRQLDPGICFQCEGASQKQLRLDGPDLAIVDFHLKKQHKSIQGLLKLPRNRVLNQEERWMQKNKTSSLPKNVHQLRLRNQFVLADVDCSKGSTLQLRTTSTFWSKNLGQKAGHWSNIIPESNRNCLGLCCVLRSQTPKIDPKASPQNKVVVVGMVVVVLQMIVNYGGTIFYLW